MDNDVTNYALDKEVYFFLANRITKMGPIIGSVLEILSKDNKGLYHEEILKGISFSDSVLRPALNSLYCAGFIDKHIKGRLNFYYINSNGNKLNQDLKRGVF